MYVSFKLCIDADPFCLTKSYFRLEKQNQQIVSENRKFLSSTLNVHLWKLRTAEDSVCTVHGW